MSADHMGPTFVGAAMLAAHRRGTGEAPERGLAHDVALRASVRRVPENIDVRACAEARVPPKWTAAARAVARFLYARDEYQARASRRGTAALLYLYGPPGTGKTIALAWAVTQCWPAPAVFAWASEVAETPRIADTRSLWTPWDTAVVMGLDECGLETDPTKVATLLTRRMETGLATIVAGNLAPADWLKRYADARLLDRVRGAQQRLGLANWYVEAAGPSLRRSAP